jgi:hypothetical protein
MFREGKAVRFTILFANIDDLMQTVWGKSFPHRNRLVGKEVEMVEDLVSGCRRQEFLDSSP